MRTPKEKTDIHGEAKTKHPAKYSKVLLPIFSKELVGYQRILDPFAGTGKVFELEKFLPDVEISALEIEKEWCEMHPRTTLGDALNLPWPESYFDAIVTSCTYGNRMADHHRARDGSKRNTYTHTLGRELHPNNSGKLQWGKAYRAFHFKAWQEVRRVLCVNGRLVLNISDHIRKGKRMPVTHFHRLLLGLMGFKLVHQINVTTPRQRQGENGSARVEYESVLTFDLPAKEPEYMKLKKFWPDMTDLPDGVDRFSQYPIAGKL